MNPCACGSGRAEATCCGPLLARAALPETAEALMRSRYVAFGRGDGAYVAETQTGAADPAELGEWGASVRWLGLTVYARTEGGAADSAGTVSFVARFVDAAGKPAVIHERSSFARRDGRWVYTTGVLPSVGRNAPCPCGQGRKYKRCCGALVG